MTLSTKAIHALSSALSDDVIDYIHQDERYAEFMIEMINDFLYEKMGQMNDVLQVELACCIMDRMSLRKS
jgi:hypothetical protein